MAASRLGLSVVGVELDDAACATRRAAGHATLQADVAVLDPAEHRAGGLIGSPPCPTFSSAGNGNGRLLTDVILACAEALADGRDTRAEARAEAERLLAQHEDADRAKRDAAMSVLVVEPLRWALANRPTWIALEQVPPVLAIWRAFAAILERHGWRCWTGILEAERYGVPQTRERAFLLAHRDRQPQPPVASHQRYVPGEPQRHDVTLEGEILPWVSMAEALGWGMTARPSTSVMGRNDGGGPRSLDGGSGARQAIERAQGDGEWITSPHPPGKRWGPNAPVAFQATNDRPNAARRPPSAPAPAPAPALAHGHNAPRWVAERPSTGVNCDPRISAPGRHDPEQSGSQQEGAIRVTPQEAAILQSFPADYPWQGSRSKVFQQIGNAVPPLLAEAVLCALLELPRPARDGGPIQVEARATHWDRRAAPSAGVEPRAVTEPAPTVLAQGLAKGRDVWRDQRPEDRDGVTHARFGNQDHSAVRAVDEPAATLRYSARSNANDWLTAPGDEPPLDAE